MIVRPRSVVRDVISFTSKSVGTRLSDPSVHLPVRCTLACPRRGPLSIPHLSFSGLKNFAFSTPSLRGFPYLTVTVRTVGGNNGLPYIVGTTSRITICTFLHKSLGFRSVPGVVRGYVNGCRRVRRPALRSVLTASGRAERCTGDLVQ